MLREDSNQMTFRTRKEAGAILRVSTSVITTEIKAGRLKAYRFGRQIRIDVRDLEDYILQCRGGKR